MEPEAPYIRMLRPCLTFAARRQPSARAAPSHTAAASSKLIAGGLGASGPRSRMHTNSACAPTRHALTPNTSSPAENWVTAVPGRLDRASQRRTKVNYAFSLGMEMTLAMPGVGTDGIKAHPTGARSLRVHDSVLQATRELLAEGGLAAATVDAISARSGVSKATVYKHWPSRTAVAAEAFGRIMAD